MSEDVIHQLIVCSAETIKGSQGGQYSRQTLTAKCGVSALKGTVPISGWHSDVSCSECLT